MPGAICPSAPGRKIGLTRAPWPVQVAHRFPHNGRKSVRLFENSRCCPLLPTLGDILRAQIGEHRTDLFRRLDVTGREFDFADSSMRVWQ